MHEGYLEHAPHEGTLRSPAGLIRLTLAPSRGSAPAGPIEDAWATVPEVRQIPPFPGSRQSLQSELSKGLLVASSFPPRDGDGTSGRSGPPRGPAPRLGPGTEREDERTRESERPPAGARTGRKRLLRHDGGDLLADNWHANPADNPGSPGSAGSPRSGGKQAPVRK
ncbi:MAG: uncharacterized protein KVP18_004541 [Porospora cf. gigantea A]|uniref:uncharacterized protein n=1 Tax=Porospora cf. gigantea A TaxID=2853593 RepID=UPI00355AA313|nr:MAG: hypothetical protein KVP18_004541 [Porospora cf. gigantea A]